MDKKKLRYINRKFPEFGEYPEGVKKQIVRFVHLRGTGAFSSGNEKYFIDIVKKGLYRRPLNRFLRSVKLFNRSELKKFRILYGKDSEEYRERQLKVYRSKPSRPEYWMERGYTFEEAKTKVSESQKRDVNFYISKGMTQEEAYSKVSGHRRKLKETARRYFETTPKEELKRNHSVSLEKFIHKHGKEKGTELYEDYRKRANYSLENMIRKYGKEKGEEAFQTRKENIVSSNAATKLYWINKGYTECEAEERRLSYVKSWKRFGREYLEKIGLSEKEVEEALEERNRKWFRTLHQNNDMDDINRRKTEHLKNRTFSISVSKASIKCFQPTIQFLDKEGVRYYCGLGEEWFIHDGKKIYFFDFYIPSINLIIEFHGKIFHAHPSVEATARHEKINPFTGENWFDLRSKDQYKENLAKQKGYEYLVVWEGDRNNSKTVLETVTKKLGEKDAKVL